MNFGFVIRESQTCPHLPVVIRHRWAFELLVSQPLLAHTLPGRIFRIPWMPENGVDGSRVTLLHRFTVHEFAARLRAMLEQPVDHLEAAPGGVDLRDRASQRHV